MTPSEFKVKLNEEPAFQAAFERQFAYTYCPLGHKVQVMVEGRRYEKLLFQHHSDEHPQSIECWWSNKEIPDEVGDTEVDIYLYTRGDSK